MSMHIQPILAALRRHKAGTVLIALQIALTLAIVCNAMFIIQQRLAHLSEPTGVDEANLLVIPNQWAGHMSPEQADAQVRTDLVALRQLPSVSDASPSDAYPLSGGGWDNFIMRKPEQLTPTTDASIYLGDEHMLDTLGVKLIAGRNFNAAEVVYMAPRQVVIPSVVIVTKALADHLYPDGSALGKPIYAMSTTPTVIVGIVERLQRQGVSQWNKAYAYESLLWPARQDATGVYYIVHAKPGQLADAMREVPRALYAQNRLRIIDPDDGGSYVQIRKRIYDSDRGMAILLAIISAVLLAITAAGIVGLTSFWVGQRRKQIGVRRALGATRGDILSYFLTENLLIGIGGVAVGVVLAIAINLWMVTQFEMARLSLIYVGIGVIALLALGQGAVLAPAIRASKVSPVEATRSV
ncbi:FtsX-like permease family protein [Rhodanobacter sp. L36]|uniref:ABC transporter permease n=1 Tax=Rhodanobacter sp. L36 TaxID=1747221 RepID=UPI00131C520C|nr:FtsX-like permease family protein [Rhodanobacter sp. L36]